jgi:hypothetical protein
VSISPCVRVREGKAQEYIVPAQTEGNTGYVASLMHTEDPGGRVGALGQGGKKRVAFRGGGD